MKNIPQKIYLQLGDDDLEASDFNSLSVVTWCEDMQHESDIEYVLAEGAERGTISPQLINEILTKYQEWAHNIPPAQFHDWDDEEGDKEKTKARIRKEFIEYLNQKG